MEFFFEYRILISGLLAWWLAQTLKMPIHYLHTRRVNFALWFSPGGMPSSHSALITGTNFAIGLFHGFNTPVFALATAVSMIVVYDATGVRRQAGIQAKLINDMITELLSGHPISEAKLKEVIGHTPQEALGGVLLGLAIPLIIWLLTP